MRASALSRWNLAAARRRRRRDAEMKMAYNIICGSINSVFAIGEIKARLQMAYLGGEYDARSFNADILEASNIKRTRKPIRRNA